MKELLLFKTMHRALKKYLFYKKWEFASKEEIKAYQYEKLLKLVNHSWLNIPFYREYWSRHGFSPKMFNSLEDLRLIPLLDKETVRRNKERMLSKTARVDKLKHAKTGATTGMPMRFYVDQKISIPKEAAALYHLFRRISYNPFARCLFWEGDLLDESKIKRGIYWKRNFFRNGLQLSSIHLNAETIYAYVDRIRRFQPHYIFAYPSSITVLCRLMKKNNIPPFKKLKHIICSSENIYDWQRKLVNEVLGVKIFSQYGHSEKCVFAGECEHSSKLHFSPYYGYVELINSKGGLCTKDGEEGEIIATGFDQKDFAFIRYRTGDKAELCNKECRCGRNFFTVKKIIGREQDFIVNQNGELNSFICSDEIFWLVPNKINAYQFIQSQKGELDLKLEVSEVLTPEEHKVLKKCLSKLLVQFSVKVFEVDHIPRTKSGKFKYLVQNLKLEQYKVNSTCH